MSSRGQKGTDAVAQKSSGSQKASRQSSRAGRTSSSSGGVGASVLVSRIGFIAVVVALILFGLVMLYSASSIYSYNLYGEYTAIFSNQLKFVAMGVLAAVGLAFFSYRSQLFSVLCMIGLIGSTVLLVAVLFEGTDALGARRWIDLGFTSIQPSEFAKIFLMVVLAYLVDKSRNEGFSLFHIGLMIVSCLIPVGLILLEPDLGTTIIAFVGILAVLWFGGLPKRVVGILGLVVVVVGIVAIFGTGFRQARITSWLDPGSDPQGDGYQLLNSYYAFGGGGIFGVGLGMSKQKFNWLPQGENDFIFAIVGEELGLIGALLVVALFFGFTFFALRIARNAPDALGAMIAGSCGVMVGAQGFLNMLCVVGALPITGKPLPFFSAGGSAFITTMLMVGLVLSVSLQSNAASVYDFRREQFTVVDGGSNKRGAKIGGSDSVLSRLPNPAAIIAGGVRSRTALPDPKLARKRSSAPSKVVPISRGKAERKSKELEAQRKKRAGYHTGTASGSRAQDAPLSLSSMRRNRVRKASGGGRGA